MSKRHEEVLMDANAIIEAHRTNCWKAIAAGYRLGTVKECLEETQRGDKHSPRYVVVPRAEVERRAKIYEVTNEMQAAAALAIPNLDVLDAGEKDLVTYAFSRSEVFLLCSPDSAVVRLAHNLGWDARLISLEELLQGINFSANLAAHFTKKWLGQFLTQLRLGVLR